MALTVTVAEDNVLVREGLVALVRSQTDLELVDACDGLDTLMASVDARPPDVVVTDIRMPPTMTDEGIRAAEAIRLTHPRTGVIVISQYDDPAYALALLKHGAAGRGYLLKQRVSSLDVVRKAIHAVADGGSFVDPQVVEALVSRQGPGSMLRFLSERELEVLANMAQGKSNDAIAESLFISRRAVEKHNNAIFSKLGLTDAGHVDKRVQAVLLFLEAGAST